MMKYLFLQELINFISEPARSKCLKLLADNKKRFGETPGALRNHQSYSGGYIHHLEETMNIARVLYDTLSHLRPLSFSLSDALLVLYLHDLEKPWKYEKDQSGNLKVKDELFDPEAQYKFQMNKIRSYGIKLTPQEQNALQYMNGESTKHSYYKRTRGPLASFCGACDSFSARIWFDYPLPKNDPWKR